MLLKLGWFGTCLGSEGVSGAHQNRNWLGLVHVSEYNLEDAEKRHCKEHSNYAPYIAKDTQGHEDHKRTKVQLVALKPWVYDVSNDVLRKDRPCGDYEYWGPVWKELYDRHEDGQNRYDNASNGWNEVHDDGKDTPQEGKVKPHALSNYVEQCSGYDAHNGLYSNVFGDLTVDSVPYSLHSSFLVLGRNVCDLWNESMPLKKEEHRHEERNEYVPPNSDG